MITRTSLYSIRRIVLTIAISFGAKILATLFLKLLERLWERLKKIDASPDVHKIDEIVKIAEKRLFKLQIMDTKLIKFNDRGLYVHFMYKGKCEIHHLYYSKSDLQLINYERENYNGYFRRRPNTQINK